MNRGFEKISFNQFLKDVNSSELLYNEYRLPRRSTVGSAGYDFKFVLNFDLKPGETYKVPTGIRAYMQKDEVLLIIIRSSLGYKKSIILPNQTGVIDSDYYMNMDNEGHIFIPIKNNSDEIVSFSAGDSFAQGIFTKYLTIDNEEDIKTTRSGGFGSTN
jgi:dUTP pyrophosphatase